MNKNINQVTRRGLPGIAAPDLVEDVESRRVLQSLIFNIQWILDNWPASINTAKSAPIPATTNESIDADTIVTGDTFAQVSYNTTTHVLQYRSPLITVVGEKVTKIGPWSNWITIETIVPET